MESIILFLMFDLLLSPKIEERKFFFESFFKSKLLFELLNEDAAEQNLKLPFISSLLIINSLLLVLFDE